MEVITIEASAWKALHHQLNRIEQIASISKQPDEIFTAEQAAKYLGVEKIWILNRKKQLKAFKEGRVVRFKKSEIDKYIAKYQL